MTDADFRRVNQRRGELVDKKYVSGLTTEETAELAELTQRIEDHWAPHYAPIIAGLERLLASRKADGAEGAEDDG